MPSCVCASLDCNPLESKDGQCTYSASFVQNWSTSISSTEANIGENFSRLCSRSPRCPVRRNETYARTRLPDRPFDGCHGARQARLFTVAAGEKSTRSNTTTCRARASTPTSAQRRSRYGSDDPLRKRPPPVDPIRDVDRAAFGQSTVDNDSKLGRTSFLLVCGRLGWFALSLGKSAGLCERPASTRLRLRFWLTLLRPAVCLHIDPVLAKYDTGGVHATW